MAKRANRRSVLKKLLLGGTALIAAPAVPFAARNPADHSIKKKNMLKGNINHSVCRWTYSFLTVDELCKHIKDIGFAAMDLVGPKDWEILKKYGVYSSMCNGAEISLTEGWNDKQY